MAVLASDILIIVDDKRRDFNSSTAIGTNQKLRALQEVLADLNMDDLLQGSYITSYVNYVDTLTNYTAPSNFKGFVEAEPTDRLSDLDVVEPEEFNRLDFGGVSEMISHDWVNDSIIWRIKTRSLIKYTTLNTLSSATGNGTWTATAGSDATNVRTDPFIYTKGMGGSVSVDVNVSQSINNYIEISNSGMSAVVLTNHVNVADELLEVYLPDATNVTSLLLRWGSGSSSLRSRQQGSLP